MARELSPHMVRMPKHFVVLYIFQLVFCILILGLTLFAVVVIPLNSLCVMVFTAFATAITRIYTITSGRCAPSLYNYWAILSLEIFCLIFWLISFALVGADTGILAIYWSGSSYCSGGYCYNSGASYSVAEATFVGIMGTAAGFGAIEFVFFLISLVIFSVMLYRHRKNGGHSKYVKDAMPPPFEAAPNADVGAEKAQMQPQAYPTSTTPAPQEYYQPQPILQETTYTGPPMHNGQQFQPVPQYPQEMPQQLSGSPAPTYQTPVQGQPPQFVHQ